MFQTTNQNHNTILSHAISSNYFDAMNLHRQKSLAPTPISSISGCPRCIYRAQSSMGSDQIEIVSTPAFARPCSTSGHTAWWSGCPLKKQVLGRCLGTLSWIPWHKKSSLFPKHHKNGSSPKMFFGLCEKTLPTSHLEQSDAFFRKTFPAPDIPWARHGMIPTQVQLGTRQPTKKGVQYTTRIWRIFYTNFGKGFNISNIFWLHPQCCWINSH